ncbi:MAG: glycoside hydrolase family 25 protein [Candidatus Kapaibacterium sp.]
MLNNVIDLSHHNASVDFAKIKNAGIAGVIHKATEGATVNDAMYTQRRTAALAQNLMWGAYHFGSPGDGVAQAKHFLAVTKPTPKDLLVLDFEQNYDSHGKPAASMSLADAVKFVTYVQQQTGRWPGLYGGSAYLQQVLGITHNATLANCWLWLAQYGPTPKIQATWPTWTMWQYTDGVNGNQPHSVDGVGNCDRDQFNGSLDGLQRLWGYATT